MEILFPCSKRESAKRRDFHPHGSVLAVSGVFLSVPACRPGAFHAPASVATCLPRTVGKLFSATLRLAPRRAGVLETGMGVEPM